MRPTSAAIAALVVGVVACSLESAGARGGDAGPVPDGGCVASGSCTQGLPPAFVPILLAEATALDCPNGVVPKRYVENPTALTGACGCDCAVTTLPTCDSGTIHREYGIGADTSCTGNGFTVTVSGCTARGTGLILADFGKVNVLPPMGGACTPKTVTASDRLTVTELRTCAAAGCAETFCAAPAPPGFRACIAGPAGATCPPSFPEAHAVGEEASVDCSACGCNLLNSECTNAAIDWYEDAACTKLSGTSAVTGTCTKEASSTLSPSHLKYRATPKADCVATGPKTATPKLSAPIAICCKLP